MTSAVRTSLIVNVIVMVPSTTIFWDALEPPRRVLALDRSRSVQLGSCGRWRSLLTVFACLSRRGFTLTGFRRRTTRKLLCRPEGAPGGDLEARGRAA